MGLPMAKATNTYDLRDQILALSASERANLLAQVAHREAIIPYEPSREDREVWSALGRLSPPGTVPHRSLDQFLRDKAQGVSRREWGEAVEAIIHFCDQAEPVRRRDEDRAALLDLVLECLAADMQKRKEWVTPKTILEALPRLHIAVDQAFPGYIAAGLLHKLIRLAEPVPA